MGQQPRLTPDELLAVAAYVEETSLDALASYADLTVAFPLVSDGPSDFPRPSPGARAAQLGVDVLRQETSDRVAVLYALAVALESGLDVPPALQVAVQPYVDAFRARPGGAPTSASAAQAEDAMEADRPA